MPLLKNNRADPRVRDAVVLDFRDLKRQGERILERARSEAAQILENARSEADALIATASEKGHALGYERGLAEGRAAGQAEGRETALAEFSDNLNTMCAAWREALERWESDRAQMLREAREDVLRFAIAFGERIIGRAIQLDPSIVVDQLAETLSLVTRPTSLVICIHPQDESLVAAALPDLTAVLNGCEHISLASREDIARGGCIVTTQAGAIDARIETQIARMTELLLPPPSTT